jgi:hypothetical protein
MIQKHDFRKNYVTPKHAFTQNATYSTYSTHLARVSASEIIAWLSRPGPFERMWERMQAYIIEQRIIIEQSIGTLEERISIDYAKENDNSPIT